MSILKAGTRLRSAVCDAEVMVVRAAAGDFRLCCGGAEMLPLGAARPEGAAIDPALAQGILIGKRYTDAQQRFEFLCTKGGKGALTLDGETLAIKDSKPLPSSD